MALFDFDNADCFAMLMFYIILASVLVYALAVVIFIL